MEVRNYSKKREVILDKVLGTKCHPSADWIYESLKQDYPDLSLATVYRNLKLFKAEGRIGSLIGITGQERFDGNTEPHGHFVCRKCSMIVDIPLSEYRADDFVCPKEIEDAKIERFEVSLYGVCMICLPSA